MGNQQQFSFKRMLKVLGISLGIFSIATILFTSGIFALIKINDKTTCEAVKKGAINENEIVC